MVLWFYGVRTYQDCVKATSVAVWDPLQRQISSSSRAQMGDVPQVGILGGHMFGLFGEGVSHGVLFRMDRKEFLCSILKLCSRGSSMQHNNMVRRSSVAGYNIRELLGVAMYCPSESSDGPW